MDSVSTPKSGKRKRNALSPAAESVQVGPSGVLRSFDFDQLAGLHVVNKSIDRDALRHQRMIADARNIVDQGLLRVRNRQPVDVVASP